jgi:glycosyltransferase involved in cell wall biosynthesis
MKVVHIIDSGGFYGAEVMLLNLCAEQIKQGLDVEVISIGRPNQPEKQLETKLKQENINCVPWRMMALPDLRESLEILHYCRTCNTSVIHSHGYKGNILLGMIPKFIRRIPLITTIHGYINHKKLRKATFYHWLDKKCLRNLDAVVLVSPSMEHQIPRQSLVNRIHVVPNGIPEAFNEPRCSILPGPSHFKDSDFKIGSIGRLSFEKNFQLLIRAMHIVVQSIPNAKLVIHGEGSDRSNLEALVDKLDLRSTVFLPGYNDQPINFYETLDVYVNCSLTEGMPISILEAMRSGCQIVATEIPANVSLLRRINHLGQLCDLSTNSLAQSIICLYHSSPDLKRKQKRIYQTEFATHYTVQKMAQRYLAVYETLT